VTNISDYNRLLALALALALKLKPGLSPGLNMIRVVSVSLSASARQVRV